VGYTGPWRPRFPFPFQTKKADFPTLALRARACVYKEVEGKRSAGKGFYTESTEIAEFGEEREQIDAATGSTEIFEEFGGGFGGGIWGWE
jgi:hypothetical protein